MQAALLAVQALLASKQWHTFCEERHCEQWHTFCEEWHSLDAWQVSGAGQGR